MKPDKPIVYNEFYLDAMTGGSPELPAPVTPEQHYLAYLAGMTVTLPQPIILRDKFLENSLITPKPQGRTWMFLSLLPERKCTGSIM